MEFSPVPGIDPERQKAMNGYSIVDALPENDFNDFIGIAAVICQTPALLINISDRLGEWVKPDAGVDIGDIMAELARKPKAGSGQRDIVIIDDVSNDERFGSKPCIAGEQNLVFFAAVPLVTTENYVLGALCIFDREPRSLDGGQVEHLHALARRISSQIDLRGKIVSLNEKQEELKRAYADLEKFSYIVSHDLKSPLNNIISLTHLLKDDYGTKLDEEGNEYITFLNVAAYQLSDLVSGILNYSRSSQVAVEHKEQINVAGLIEEITSQLNLQPNAVVNYKKDKKNIYSSRAALKQILLNLLHNAIKYNDKSQVVIDIKLREDKRNYIFEIKDNGDGIAKEHHDRVFELFERLHNKKDGESMGVGLAVVKRLVEKLGGEIKINSEVSEGATFTFSIAK
jgi:signal transduction histidine kinase